MAASVPRAMSRCDLPVPESPISQPYPGTAMPSTCIDTADAIELAETLELIAHWLTADPERLAASLLDFIGHPAYGPGALRPDRGPFTFLRGGNDGEFLLGDNPDFPRRPRRERGQNSRTKITRA